MTAVQPPWKWDAPALCAEVDPELWFPEPGGTGSDARKVCHSCEAITDCLEWAVATDQREGVWGGASKGERRLMAEGVLPIVPPLWLREDREFAATLDGLADDVPGFDVDIECSDLPLAIDWDSMSLADVA